MEVLNSRGCWAINILQPPKGAFSVWPFLKEAYLTELILDLLSDQIHRHCDLSWPILFFHRYCWAIQLQCLLMEDYQNL